MTPRTETQILVADGPIRPGFGGGGPIALFGGRHEQCGRWGGPTGTPGGQARGPLLEATGPMVLEPPGVAGRISSGADRNPWSLGSIPAALCRRVLAKALAGPALRLYYRPLA